MNFIPPAKPGPFNAAGFSQNSTSPNPSNSIHDSIESENFEEIKNYLEKSSSNEIAMALEKFDHEKRTPLMLAASLGNDKIVDLLLNCNHQLTDQQRKIDVINSLLISARLGHGEALRSLCTALEDVNCSDDIGNTPLILATAGGHTSIVHALIFSGANVSATNAYKQSALTEAVAGGHIDIVGTLLSQSARLGEKSKVKTDAMEYDLVALAELSENSEMI